MKMPLFLLLLPVYALAAQTPSAAAKASFERAEKEFEEGKYGAAAASYQEALKASPKWAPALVGLGSSSFKQNGCDKLTADAAKPQACVEAVTHFKAAAEADASYAMAWFNLGYASRKLQDFKTAAAAYEKYNMLESDPDGLFGLAESYRQLGEKEKAIATYERYLKAETRASEQKWVEKAKDAIAQLKTAPAPRPSPSPVLVGSVTASKPSPLPAPSSESLPQAAAKRLAEGNRLLEEKKYREASFAFQDAVNADPGNVAALGQLGKCYAVLGYYTQAIERWNKVIQLTPDASTRKIAEDNIARAQAKIAEQGGGSPQAAGRPPGSGPIAESTRSHARAYYEAAVRLIAKKDYANALNQLNECLRLEPALAVGYIARGSALIGLRRYSEAATDYQYAGKLDSNRAAPLFGLAEAYWGMNRAMDAKGYYERYIASAAPDVSADLQASARQKLEQLKDAQ